MANHCKECGIEVPGNKPLCLYCLRNRRLHNKNHKPKPQRIKSPVYRCECGMIATHKADIRVGDGGQYKITLYLCSHCYEIERSFNLPIPLSSCHKL